MRILFAVPLIFVAACDVDNDAQNDQVTIQYDENQAENVAEDIGNAAEDAGNAIANGAEDVANTVENTDVDIHTDGNNH